MLSQISTTAHPPGPSTSVVDLRQRCNQRILATTIRPYLSQQQGLRLENTSLHGLLLHRTFKRPWKAAPGNGISEASIPPAVTWKSCRVFQYSIASSLLGLNSVQHGVTLERIHLSNPTVRLERADITDHKCGENSSTSSRSDCTSICMYQAKNINCRPSRTPSTLFLPFCPSNFKASSPP